MNIKFKLLTGMPRGRRPKSRRHGAADSSAADSNEYAKHEEELDDR